MSDLRFAFRSLLKSPGFTAVSLLTLALGIGATAAIFSVVNAVVLRPLAHPRSAELVTVRCVVPALPPEHRTVPVNARFFTEWRTCPAFSELALLDYGRVALTGSGEPARLSSVRSSANLFAALGTIPALGRTFAIDEDKDGKAPVAIISDRLWRDHFAADPAILGRSIAIDFRPVTVIGVLPARFRLPDSKSGEPDIYLPRVLGAKEVAEIIGRFNYDVIGRLAPGASIADAETQLNVVAARLCQLDGGSTEVRGSLTPLQAAIAGPFRRGLWILFGAVGAVLLLACLNLGILGLARAERRDHDAAVRAALGASRARLFTHALAESLVLSLGGGLLGCLLAGWGLDALIGLAPADLPRLDEIKLDYTVLAFALGATFLATLLSGLAPAWHSARSNASFALLARSGRTVTGSAAARRLRHTFIAVEIGVSTLLLATAALLVGSFIRLVRADVGFQAPAVLTTEITIPFAKYGTPAERDTYHRRLLTAVSAAPGVVSAAVSTALPLTGETWVDTLWLSGDTRPMAERARTNTRFVSPDYFNTLGIPLVAGRAFRDDDGSQAAIVSAQLAATLWPGQDPIGRKVRRHDERLDRNEYVVIGVAGDIRANVDRRPVSFIYRPHWAWSPSEMTLSVRCSGAMTAVAPAIRRAIQSVDADVPLQSFRTIDDIFDSAVAQRRFQMRLVVAFALSALTLAGLGIYGVVSHGVNQRTRELGIRLTFGAPPAALRRMVLLQGMTPVAVGLLGGVVAALLGGQLLTGLLYETTARDPLALSSVVLVLFTIALLACWVPVRRATRVDPIEALRAE